MFSGRAACLNQPSLVIPKGVSTARVLVPTAPAAIYDPDWRPARAGKRRPLGRPADELVAHDRHSPIGGDSAPPDCP